ncbi:MAG: phosphoenolpyruvate--protein phosphotransferase [Spirochaetes bacterium]|nr:phosphoenolpyruvate--protein phosphotransferase [Spirochaetota bacterium]
MFNILPENVGLASQVTSKTAAIAAVGKLLTDSGFIEERYIESMLERETIANTYIGNGIAIPHGLPKNRDAINKTGISVLQVPNGVEWNPGETVKIVVGIAAMSEEHIEVLQHLTYLLDDVEAVNTISATNDKNLIIEKISGIKPTATEAESPINLNEFSDFVDCIVPGHVGLHARPATYFVDTAKNFKSKIVVIFGDKHANGKSLAALLKLGAKGGSAIKIYAAGDDAKAAVDRLKKLIDTELEEDEEPEIVSSVNITWNPVAVETSIKGLPASQGIAIGKIKFLKKEKIVFEKSAKDPAAEEGKLKNAIAEAVIELKELYEDIRERTGESKAAIFRAHIEFLEDPDLINNAHHHILKGLSAAFAWEKAFEENASSLEQLNNQTLAERATDMRDVGKRVLRLIAGKKVDESTFIPESPVILLAEDLTPSDTASLDPNLVLGFCTATGGPTSHTAITARSLGIPAIVGCGPALMHAQEDANVILDGSNGNLYIKPSMSDISAAEEIKKTLQQKMNIQYEERFKPAFTTDDHRMEITANIGNVADAENAVNNGAEGIGLIRSEFLFLERETAPTEEEQYVAYSNISKTMNGLPLIIRTLDIGGDKNVPYLKMPKEDNAFLGVRGIRLCLMKEDIFRTQLRAIYRASKKGTISIMFPMIATLEELQQAKAIAEDVRKEVGANPVDIGMMIEVPSAVMLADEFAQEVDFFSIGTNDLTQYTLAMDRLHPALAKNADGLHPAVLRMIEKTVAASLKAGIWTGVCGGIAGEPLGAAILTGLGVRELSVSVPSVSAIKAKIRNIAYSEAITIAQQALQCTTAAEVRRLKI